MGETIAKGFLIPHGCNINKSNHNSVGGNSLIKSLRICENFKIKNISTFYHFKLKVCRYCDIKNVMWKMTLKNYQKKSFFRSIKKEKN